MIPLPTTHVDWYCTKCGLEHETTLRGYSYPTRCPSCSQSSIVSGHPHKPVNHVWADAEPKNYDLCSNRKEIQVYLRAATGESVGQCVSPNWELDLDGDAIEAAERFLALCKTRYLFCSNLSRIEAVIQAMRACEPLSKLNALHNNLYALRRRIVLAVLDWNEAMEDEDESTE